MLFLASIQVLASFLPQMMDQLLPSRDTGNTLNTVVSPHHQDRQDILRESVLEVLHYP